MECVIHKKKYLIGTLYRPPNSDNDVWDLIAYSMEKSKDTKLENILITGDFNENLNCTQNPKIIDIISDLGMTQIIRDPTHFTENSQTLLDLITVNNVESIDFSGVGDNKLPSNIRYHCPINCALKLPKSCTKTFTRRVWLFSNNNFDDYKTILRNQNCISHQVLT